MPSNDDGKRILIDRLCPKWISKANAQLDMWLKEVAPSTELRTWYRHSPERQEVFRNLYEQELSLDSIRSDVVKLLKRMSEESNITLLYSSNDKVYNNA